MMTIGMDWSHAPETSISCLRGTHKLEKKKLSKEHIIKNHRLDFNN